MIKKIAWQWEVLDETTSRAKVIGGWIIRSRSNKAESMVFVQDRDHEYTIVKPYVEEKPQPNKLAAADFKAPA